MMMCMYVSYMINIEDRRLLVTAKKKKDTMVD